MVKSEFSSGYSTRVNSDGDEDYNIANTAVYKSESAADENTALLSSEKNDGLEALDVSRGAWMSLIGSTSGMLTTFGYVVVIGIFQEYYQSNQLMNYSPSEISWITSMEIFLTIFMAAFVGAAYDVIGPKPLIIPGTILMTVGIMLTSISTQYYQIMLSQGVLTAIGGAMIFHACAPAISSWFDKYRATALGIGNAGSALGGVFIPVIFRQVVDYAGFGWAVRAIGFVLLFVSSISCLLTTSRVPPPGPQKIDLYKTYIVPFKYLPFTFTAVGVFIVYWGVFIPQNYIPSHAVAHGVSPGLANYLISILNAVSIFGRILPGMFADKFGRFNSYFLCCFMAGLLTLAIWIPAQSVGVIILYAASYGFFSGAATSVWHSVIADISPSEEIGARLGTVNSFMSFATLSGGPIAGAIITSNGGEYYGAATFAGVVMIVGSFFILAGKVAHTGDIWSRK
ncbi:major facilitator superfamily domain-containing protein [Myxozyma melibiosi]|uniref:Major facilitator superfamily domain-containing protein n=1 Tax=Myxozyma melibiosi TaxID=54550 RepID=A0ABR1FFB5_9ASCO